MIVERQRQVNESVQGHCTTTCTYVLLFSMPNASPPVTLSADDAYLVLPNQRTLREGRRT
jgi:hypothetical protein